MKSWILMLGLTLSLACGGKQQAPAEPPFDWKVSTDQGVNMQWSKISQPGRTTPWNEDAVLVDAEQRIMVVADGTGANGAAADMVVEAIESQEEGDFIAAILETNKAVYEAASTEGPQKGMAASLVAVGVAPGKAYVAHVGDVRLYRLRGEEIAAMTTDHVADNRRTREVGQSDALDLELKVVDVEPGDRWLIASKGVHKVVPEKRLTEVLGSDATPPDKLKSLVGDVAAANLPYDASMILLEF